jgi:hypothetical protein
VYGLRGIPSSGLRNSLIDLASRLPGRGDYQTVVPFTVHFGWLHQKPHFNAFVEREWARLVADADREESVLHEAV